MFLCFAEEGAHSGREVIKVGLAHRSLDLEPAPPPSRMPGRHGSNGILVWVQPGVDPALLDLLLIACESSLGRVTSDGPLVQMQHPLLAPQNFVLPRLQPIRLLLKPG